MSASHRSTIGRTLERFSGLIAHWTGSSLAFAVACLVIVVWAVTGPIFGWSDTWQLVINTGTTIVTFLMVFLIQRAQNKDALAIQMKLNELVASIDGASNRLIDVEGLSEAELETLHEFYSKLARMAKHDSDIRQSHSVDEAHVRHTHKLQARPDRPNRPDQT
jgi:low affinity Fe/Cu permease